MQEKFRIKEVVRGDNSRQYYPQVRHYFKLLWVIPKYYWMFIQYDENNIASLLLEEFTYPCKTRDQAAKVIESYKERSAAHSEKKVKYEYL